MFDPMSGTRFYSNHVCKTRSCVPCRWGVFSELTEHYVRTDGPNQKICDFIECEGGLLFLMKTLSCCRSAVFARTALLCCAKSAKTSIVKIVSGRAHTSMSKRKTPVYLLYFRAQHAKGFRAKHAKEDIPMCHVCEYQMASVSVLQKKYCDACFQTTLANGNKKELLEYSKRILGACAECETRSGRWECRRLAACPWNFLALMFALQLW